ncbi:MAG: prepilin-type N-terminal cleavage/methylation domain-containing protein [Planctomycetota bacterium]|nr:prepilin-type N-terminal cleavage/methylation domain-containing protein [Planctomycetota bacterium]
MASGGNGVVAPRRAFSLVEVLMAIFILGIGVISIAALFPAGIAQQRKSVDDVMGPIVAENALAVLRSKLSPEDFGTFEEFSPDYPQVITVFSPRPTVPGDWSWLRPAFIRANTYPDKWPYGAIDIFNGAYHQSVTAQVEFPGGYGDTDPFLDAIPYNTDRYGGTPPAIIFSQQERFYPQASHTPIDYSNITGEERLPKPQYVWDCMFRRFQGRILVAIFVYRVSMPGGEMSEYAVPQPPGSGLKPLIPVWVELTDANEPEPWRGEAWDAYGEDLIEGTADDALLVGTTGEEYDITNNAHQWQMGGQWLLDQNNNVHRVLSGRRNPADGPVELLRPPPAMPAVNSYYMLAPDDPNRVGMDNIVTDIWYIPTTLISQGVEYRFTPVYIAVKEL